MTKAVLEARGLSKRFGGVIAADCVDFAVADGEVHAVIGPNGSGKTTLLRQLAGEVRPDSGRVLLDGTDVTRLRAHRRARAGIARSFQITSVFPGFTALDNVAFGVRARSGTSFRFWRPVRGSDDAGDKARALLDCVGLGGRADLPVNVFSHGEHRQLEVAIALSTRPRVLLLDEPLAGLGLAESAAMVALLATLRERHALVLVEHDIDAVFALADRVTVLVEGRVLTAGAPAAVRGNAEVRRAYLGEDGA